MAKSFFYGILIIYGLTNGTLKGVNDDETKIFSDPAQSGYAVYAAAAGRSAGLLS